MFQLSLIQDPSVVWPTHNVFLFVSNTPFSTEKPEEAP